MRTWDLATGKQTAAVALQGESGKSIAAYKVAYPDEQQQPSTRDTHLFFSPDRRYLAAVFSNRVIVWDSETGRELSNVAVACESGKFSPNGKLLALFCQKDAVLIEWKSGRVWAIDFRVTHDHNGAVDCSMRFAQDGKRLVIWGFNQEPIVYDTQNGSRLYTIDAGRLLTSHATSLSSTSPMQNR